MPRARAIATNFRSESSTSARWETETEQTVREQLEASGGNQRNDACHRGVISCLGGVFFRLIRQMRVSVRFKVRFPSLAPPRHTPQLGNFGGRHWRSKYVTFYPTSTYRLGRETPFPFPSHDLLARRQMSLWHSRGRTRISPMSTQPSDGACWHNYLAASVCAFLNSQLQIDLRSRSSPPRGLAASYLGGELAVAGAADRNCVATPAVMSDGRFPAA